MYLKAFQTLTADRPVSVGLAVCYGRIPFSAIDRYACRYGVDDPDDFDLLVRVVAALDRAEVAILNKPPPKS